jgi:hypothetical protein
MENALEDLAVTAGDLPPALKEDRMNNVLRNDT